MAKTDSVAPRSRVSVLEPGNAHRRQWLRWLEAYTSSRIATPLEAQASALVPFLAEAKHSLLLETALEVCNSIHVAKEPSAYSLKVALAGRNIEVKHTSCLKAAALMDGFDGHVSRLKPAQVVAQYTSGAPAITPRVRQHHENTDVTADPYNQLAKNLTDAKGSLYVRIAR